MRQSVIFRGLGSKIWLTALCLIMSTINLLPGLATAMSDQDINAVLTDTTFYSPDSADAGGRGQVNLVGPITGLTTSCYQTVMPSVTDAQAFAKVLDDFIAAYHPAGGDKTNKFIGLGNDLVAAGQQYGINPMLIIIIAEHESGMGAATPKDTATGEESYNSYGRTATASQPHVTARPNGIDAATGQPYAPRLWYKSASWRDSIYDEADILQKLYTSTLSPPNDLVAALNKYAPPVENNTNGYIQFVVGVMDKIITAAGPLLTCTDKGNPALNLPINPSASPPAVTGTGPR